MNESQQAAVWRQNRVRRLENRKEETIKKLMVYTARCTSDYLVSLILCGAVMVFSYYYGLGGHVAVRTQLQRTVDEATVFAFDVFVAGLMLLLRTPVLVTAIRFCVWIMCHDNLDRFFDLIGLVGASILVPILLVVFVTQVWPGPAFADILKTRNKVVLFHRPLSFAFSSQVSPPGREDKLHPLHSLGHIPNTLVDSPLVVGQHFIVDTPGKATLGGQPYSQEFHRYVSEDIELTCHVVYPYINSCEPLADLTFSWTLNGRCLRLNTGRVWVGNSSEGHSSQACCPESGEVEPPSWFKKQSVIIHRLEDEDFGTYECHATSSASDPAVVNKVQHAQDNTTSPTTHTVGRFHVILQEPEVRDVYIPPHGIMLVAFSFWTHRLSRSWWRLFDVSHILNDKWVDMDQEYKVDTPAAFLHELQHNVIDFPMKDGKPGRYVQRNHVIDEDSGCTLRVDVFKWCAHPMTYGVHRFIVYREFIDEETKRVGVTRTKFPLTIRQVPSFPGVLGHVDDFGDATFDDGCWDRPAQSDICQKRSNDLSLKFYWQHVGDRAAFYFFVSVLFSLLIPLPFLTFIVFKAHGKFVSTGSYCPPEIKTPCGLRLEGRPFSKRHRQPDTLHDVFLSYHPNDSHTAGTARDILMSQNLCVFDSHSDVSPGQHRLKAWSDAMDRSSSFLVVVSHSYVADPELNELQFRCLYDCMLQGEVPEDRMVLLKADNCRVLPSLGPLPLLDVAQPRWRRHLHFLCEGEDRMLQVRYYRKLWCVTVNYVRDLRDLVLVVWYYVVKVLSFLRHILCGQSLPRNAENVQHEPCVGGTAFEVDNDTTDFNLLLSYCSQSHSDRAKARKVKVAIQGEGLSVFDEVRPGQEHTQLVTSAATCQAFVIVLSPAYRRHPLTRRLHFPQLLQALESGRVSPDAVLIVKTTTTNDDDDDDNDDDDDEVWQSPEWFQAFSTVQWTGNLSDEDHSRKVRVWARKVRHQIINNRLDDRGGRDQLG